MITNNKKMCLKVLGSQKFYNESGYFFSIEKVLHSPCVLGEHTAASYYRHHCPTYAHNSLSLA